MTFWPKKPSISHHVSWSLRNRRGTGRAIPLYNIWTWTCSAALIKGSTAGLGSFPKMSAVLPKREKERGEGRFRGSQLQWFSDLGLEYLPYVFFPRKVLESLTITHHDIWCIIFYRNNQVFYSFIILSNSWHLPRQEGIILGHQTQLLHW